jgi:hypothetical protein
MGVRALVLCKVDSESPLCFFSANFFSQLHVHIEKLVEKENIIHVLHERNENP